MVKSRNPMPITCAKGVVQREVFSNNMPPTANIRTGVITAEDYANTAIRPNSSAQEESKDKLDTHNQTSQLNDTYVLILNLAYTLKWGMRLLTYQYYIKTEI